MPTAKDGVRSKVRVGYDRRVYKTFRGTGAADRFHNEIHVLKVLEDRGCGFVPRVLDYDEETLTLVTSNCGTPVERMSDEKRKQIFRDLEESYGVVHDDPYLRNITYDPQLGRFCVIDFELATVVERGDEKHGELSLHWGGLSRSGSRKPQNDDALAVFTSEEGWARRMDLTGKLELVKEGAVFVISDGMGGAKGGHIASRLVVSELCRFLPGRMGEFHDQADLASVLRSAVKDLQDYLVRMEKAHPEWEGMGATMVAGLFLRREMCFAHVGDSRLYRFRGGNLEQLTFDHTMVGRRFRDGKITELQARLHPQRHVLNRILGAGAATVEPQIGALALEGDDCFLFCSDGLIDGLWDMNITALLDRAGKENWSEQQTAERLVHDAMATAGTDDTTVFFLRVTESDLEEG